MESSEAGFLCLVAAAQTSTFGLRTALNKIPRRRTAAGNAASNRSSVTIATGLTPSWDSAACTSCAGSVWSGRTFKYEGMKTFGMRFKCKSDLIRLECKNERKELFSVLIQDPNLFNKVSCLIKCFTVTGIKAKWHRGNAVLTRKPRRPELDRGGTGLRVPAQLQYEWIPTSGSSFSSL